MIKLHNKTDLSYKTIGQVIDHYVDDSNLETHYPGKEDCFDFVYKKIKYNCKIVYSLKDVDWYFTYVL